MMKIIACLLFCVSCSFLTNTQLEPLDLLIGVHKDGKLDDLVQAFGEPEEIEKTKDKGIVKYVYKKPTSFFSYVDKKNKTVESSSLLFWKTSDDYEYLKSKYGNEEWLEKKLADKSHSGNENYEVRVPRLGLEFEYNKHSPKILYINIYTNKNLLTN
ncbi:MAG: hypothetical protein ACLGG0_11600 [Bacteriovoracia bacterium]